jgi:hypothetical protein
MSAAERAAATTKEDTMSTSVRRRLRRLSIVAATTLGCGLLVAPAAPAHALTGATVVATPSVVNSLNKSATATCPPNTKVFGAGAKILDGLGNVHISDLVPADDLLSVRAEGAENDNNFATDWQVIAYAICGPEVGNMERIEVPDDDNGTSDSPRTTVAECDNNRVIYGTGWQLSGAGGNVFIDAARVDQVADPIDVAVTAYEDANYAANWDLTAYAICGDPDVPVYVEYDFSTYAADPYHEVDVQCDPGYTVTGIGGALNGDSGDNLMDRLQPSTSLRKATVAGRINGTPNIDWGVDVFAICAGV